MLNMIRPSISQKRQDIYISKLGIIASRNYVLPYNEAGLNAAQFQELLYQGIMISHLRPAEIQHMFKRSYVISANRKNITKSQQRAKDINKNCKT